MRRIGGRVIILYWTIVGVGLAQQSKSFDGIWVFHSNGQNILKLTLLNSSGRISGSLTEPKDLSIDQDGDVTRIAGDPVTLPVQDAKLGPAQLELTIDGDRYTMTIEDQDRAQLSLEGMHPIQVDHVPEGDSVTLATTLKEPDYPKDILALREQLRTMVKEDQDARLAYDIPRMEAADTKNRPVVLQIFDKYGWVTNSLAGKAAAHDYWLLIQHQTPEIQQKLLPALEKAANAHNASMTDYAYLYDRVQTGLNKPQHWGSQVKCEKGKPVLMPVDDPDGLDARRKELYMQPVSEYVAGMAKACAQLGK